MIRMPYVFRVALGDVITPWMHSDNWDVNAVHALFSDLKYYTAFETEDLYLNSANYGDLFCFQHYGHHFLHKSNTVRNHVNYTQWEHCPVPFQGSSQTQKNKFVNFAGYNLSDLKSYYYKLGAQTHTKFLSSC